MDPGIELPGNGYAVKFHRFDPECILVAISLANGSGRLNVLDCTSDLDISAASTIWPRESFHFAAGILDCSWSTVNTCSNFAVSGAKDGSVQIWNTSLPPAQNPVVTLNGHLLPVVSVDWLAGNILSASLGSVKLWYASRRECPDTFSSEPHHYFNAVTWSPNCHSHFATASSDCNATIWDHRQGQPRVVDFGHGDQVVSCDWSKSGIDHLATATIRGDIFVWDPRYASTHLYSTSYPHFRGIIGRPKVVFSHHRPQVLVYSCGMDVMICDHTRNDCIVYQNHNACVLGIDSSPHVDRLYASTGADDYAFVWKHVLEP